MGEIIIEESNYRAVAMLLANLFMLIASVAIFMYGVTKDRMLYLIPGMMAALLFLIGFFVSLQKAMKVKKLITITMDGIIDNSSISGIGYISFDDIKEFQIEKIYRSRVISIIPKNMESFLTKLSVVKRSQVKRNIAMKLPPITINVELAKDMEPEDILSLLQKRLTDYSRLYE